MACNITSGRALQCKESIAGINAIYVIPYTSASFTANSDNEITAFPSGSGAAALTAYKFEVKNGGTSFTETVTSDRNNGTTFFAQSLAVTLPSISAAMHKQLKLLAVSRNQIVISLKNGEALLLGKDFGVDVNGGTVVSGANPGDLQGYTLSFMAEEKDPANLLDAATLADPFAGITNKPTVVM